MSFNNNEVKEPTLTEFYAGKNIFVTGGTGFIGTVLIEELLSTTPKIGKIYLLIRDKYGSDTNERIRRLLSKQVGSIFIINIFDEKKPKNCTRIETNYFTLIKTDIRIAF